MVTKSTASSSKKSTKLPSLASKSGRKAFTAVKKQPPLAALPKAKVKAANKAKVPDSITKIPATVQGKGYKLVNLNSMDQAMLLIETKAVAEILYSWNSNLVPYGVIQRLSSGVHWQMALSTLLSAENFEELKDEFSELYGNLQNTILARRKMIDLIVTENRPVPFELLPEVLQPNVGKYIIVRSGGKETFVKLHAVQMRASLFGVFSQVSYLFQVWSEGRLKTKMNTIRVMPRAESFTLADWGFITKPSQEQLDFLLTRGRKVLALNETCGYINIKGTLSYKVSWFTREAQATGRGIVDKTGHAIFNPNERTDDDYGDMDHDDNSSVKVADAKDDDLRSLDPMLTVFSFVAKKWGTIHVDQAHDINFRDNAFDKLVIPTEDKKLVLSLVKNSDASLVSDLIDNKGGGCVLLLHGKPGLGKTLTAEAVAEVLTRPLYAVSVGELGTDPESLEEKLQTVLQTAQRWNAVLLLDEADVFLEERRNGDINRNAMVGTFLRLLEYYNGVLILTTNRVADMDQAFYSRISLALRYNDFGVETREQVIENLLDTNGVKLEASAVTMISKMDVNGRQIKNAIRLARFMSKDEARGVEAKDIILVLTKLQEFQDSFKN